MNSHIIASKRISKKYACIDCGSEITRRSVRCMDCKAKAQLMPDSGYYDLARERGILWIGVNPNSTHVSTRWQCPDGHQWMARYGSIRIGGGCPKCNMASKSVKPEDFYALAAIRGFVWIGPPVPNNHIKTEWRGACGHVWMSAYKSIHKGDGCPRCRKVQAADYMALATERGFIWNGELPQRTAYPTGWQCSVGHTWNARYSSVKEGRGCPHCSDIAERFKDENYHALAAKRGFLWIGELPNGAHEKTEWQCSNGHKWEASYSGINTGYGCTSCLDYENGAKASKHQRAIFEMVGGIMNHRVGRLSVDVALQLPTARIAIEYDSFYWHGEYQERDAKRADRLIKAGWKVLAIKARNMIPTLEQIQEGIFTLMAGETYTEIVLPDWGTGNTIRNKAAAPAAPLDPEAG